jgi:hypothetical protein
MNNILSFSVLNSYSKNEYKNKLTVLDAAFALLRDNIKITTDIKEYSFDFIVYILAEICINIINDLDNETYLVNNYYKSFVYNLIYMTKNRSISDIETFYDFYKKYDFVINMYLNNTITDDNSTYLLDSYKKKIELFFENQLNIIDSNLLIEITNDDASIDDYKYNYYYIMFYYYILLVNDIKSTNDNNNSIILLKTLKYVAIIYYCIDNLSNHAKAIVDTNITSDPYLNNIYDNVYNLFITRLDGDGGITVSFPTIYDVYDAFTNNTEFLKCLINITDHQNNYYKNTNQDITNLLIKILYNINDQPQPKFFTDVYYELITIVDDIRDLPDNEGGLIKFLKHIITSNSKSDEIINAMTNSQTNLTENIIETLDYFIEDILLNNEENEENNKKNINNLFIEINNIYKNNIVLIYLHDVKTLYENNAITFFKNTINLYIKLQRINSLPHNDESFIMEPFNLPDFELNDYVGFPKNNLLKIGYINLGKTKTIYSPMDQFLLIPDQANQTYQDINNIITNFNNF